MTPCTANPLYQSPSNLHRLSRLRLLDLSSCSLESLCKSLAQCKAEYDLFDNPFLHLPAQDASSAVLRKWLETDGDTDEAVRVKLLILGHGGAGKTTLLRSLQRMTGDKSLPDEDEGVEEEEEEGALWERFWFRPLWPTKSSVLADASTIGLDPSALALSERLQFTVWDFAGQMEYLSVHQFFLSAQAAIYIIVTDISQSPEIQKARLDYWIGLLKARLPVRATFRLVFVGTKIDLVPSPEVLRQHKAAVDAFIQTQPFSALPELQLVSNTNLSGLKDLMRVIKQAAAALMSRQVRSAESITRSP